MCGMARLPLVVSFLLLTFSLTDAVEVVTYKPPNVLNPRYSGRCPIPRFCQDTGVNATCGEELSSTHVTFNCSNRDAGPYMPGFQEYLLKRRTWAIDFSYNSITKLESISFLTSNRRAMNLTSLDLSHNYISVIEKTTFRGDISKDLTVLDLSYNRLSSIAEGTFAEMPALTDLNLSRNRLLVLSAICSTPFPSLTQLNAAYNKLSSIPLRCLSTAQKTVNVKLSNNYLSSINDCSFSDKMKADVSANPTLCGCSSKQVSKPCLRLGDGSNKTSPSTQTSCPSSALSTCLNITYELKYAPIDAEVYTVRLQVPGALKPTVELLQYASLDKWPASSALLIQSGSAPFNSSQLSRSRSYALCIRAGVDTLGAQRRCQWLSPPYFRPSAASRVTGAYSLLACLTLFLALFAG